MRVQLSQVMWQEHSQTLTATQNLQCYQPYTTLTDAWRSISDGEHGPDGRSMGDQASCTNSRSFYATGVGGGGWYRFAGAGGDALHVRTRANIIVASL